MTAECEVALNIDGGGGAFGDLCKLLRSVTIHDVKAVEKKLQVECRFAGLFFLYHAWYHVQRAVIHPYKISGRQMLCFVHINALCLIGLKEFFEKNGVHDTIFMIFLDMYSEFGNAIFKDRNVKIATNTICDGCLIFCWAYRLRTRHGKMYGELTRRRDINLTEILDEHNLAMKHDWRNEKQDICAVFKVPSLPITRKPYKSSIARRAAKSRQKALS